MVQCRIQRLRDGSELVCRVQTDDFCLGTRDENTWVNRFDRHFAYRTKSDRPGTSDKLHLKKPLFRSMA